MRRSFPSACERCGEKDVVLIGSFFDQKHVCPRCNDIERAHPDFQRAHDTEVQHVQAGNYNYPGIGVPIGLPDACKAERERDASASPHPKTA